MKHRCPECGAPEMKTFDGETMKVEHEGRSVDVAELSGWRCPSCSEVIFDHASAKAYADAGDALVLQACQNEADSTVFLNLEGLDKHPPVPDDIPGVGVRDGRFFLELSWADGEVCFDKAYRHCDEYVVVGAMCYWRASIEGQTELAQAWDDWMTACLNRLQAINRGN